MTKKIKEALIDVRKAYRLVYLYQKSIISTIDRFSEEFSSVFYYWTPNEYGTPPIRTTDLTKKWTWDLLPFYHASILYLFDNKINDNVSGKKSKKVNDISAKSWILSFQLMTDTAFEIENGEPNPKNFDNAGSELSRSVLIVSLFYFNNDLEGESYINFWEKLEYPDDEYIEYDNYQGVFCVKKEFFLEELETEEMIMSAVSMFKKMLKNIYIKKTGSNESSINNSSYLLQRAQARFTLAVEMPKWMAVCLILASLLYRHLATNESSIVFALPRRLPSARQRSMPAI
jgi:hypothetical protein